VNTLPTDRDLPPARRAELRADLLDAVAHRPPSRRWVPLAAAAALVAVVGGATVAVSNHDRGAPTTGVAGTRTPATPTPTDRNDYTVVPLGLTRFTPDAATRAVVAACGPSFNLEPIRLAVEMRYGRLALLSPGEEAISCSLPKPGTANPLGGTGSATGYGAASPVPSPVRYEGASGSVLGEGTFLSTTQGKVTAAVKRLTLTYGHQTVDAVMGNGVFVGGAILKYRGSPPLPRTVPENARSSYSPNPLPEPTVRGYDAAGTLIYDSTDMVEDRAGRGDLSCAKGPGRCRYPWP
jgi:hypothetical protein